MKITIDCLLCCWILGLVSVFAKAAVAPAITSERDDFSHLGCIGGIYLGVSVPKRNLCEGQTCVLQVESQVEGPFLDDTFIALCKLVGGLLDTTSASTFFLVFDWCESSS